MRALMISTSMMGTAILAASAVMPASAAPQYYGSNSSTIRCESNDQRTRECTTGGGRVVLERQLSNNACIEGRSWGYTRDGIWVAQGCRADFRIVGNDGGYRGDNDGRYPNGNSGGNYGNQGYGNNQVVRCESNDGRNRTCPMDTRGGVQMVRQLSRSACIEGRNWGANRGGVWVTDGCRADFRSGGSYGGSGNGYGNDYGMGGRVFRCESNGRQVRECAANTRAGVQLVRQLSSAACIQGRTWGYGRSGIWVSDGCRAEFRSY